MKKLSFIVFLFINLMTVSLIHGQKVSSGLLGYWSFNSSLNTYNNYLGRPEKGSEVILPQGNGGYFRQYLYPNEKPKPRYLIKKGGVQSGCLCENNSSLGWTPNIRLALDQDFSISFWFKYGESGYGELIKKFDPNTKEELFAVEAFKFSEPKVEVRFGGEKVVFPYSYFRPHQWMNLTVIFQSGNLKIHINEELIGEKNYYKIKDKKRYVLGFNTGIRRICIDELYIFQKALTKEEHSQLLAEGESAIRKSLTTDFNNSIRKFNKAEQLVRAVHDQKDNPRYAKINTSEFSFELQPSYTVETFQKAEKEITDYPFLGEDKKEIIVKKIKSNWLTSFIDENWSDVKKENFSEEALLNFKKVLGENRNLIENWDPDRAIQWIDLAVEFQRECQNFVFFDCQRLTKFFEAHENFLHFNLNRLKTLNEEFKNRKECYEKTIANKVKEIEFDGIYFFDENDKYYGEEVVCKNYHYTKVLWKATFHAKRYFTQSSDFTLLKNFERIIIAGSNFSDENIDELHIFPAENLSLYGKYLWSPNETVHNTYVWSPQQTNNGDYKSIKFKRKKLSNNKFEILVNEPMIPNKRYMIVHNNSCWMFEVLEEKKVETQREKLVFQPLPDYDGLYVCNAETQYLELSEKKIHSGEYIYNPLKNGFGQKKEKVLFYDDEEIISGLLPQISNADLKGLMLNLPGDISSAILFPLQMKKLGQSKLVNKVFKDVVRGDGLMITSGNVFITGQPINYKIKTVNESRRFFVCDQPLSPGFYVFKLNGHDWVFEIV